MNPTPRLFEMNEEVYFLYDDEWFKENFVDKFIEGEHILRYA
jgi:hypothetical protein